MLKQKVHSHYFKNYEDFRVKQHKFNVFRNLHREIGSKLVNKTPKAIQILDDL